MTLAEVAAYFDVSTKTVRNWIRANLIAHYRIGKEYRFRFSSVKAWIDRREVHPRFKCWHDAKAAKNSPEALHV